MSETILPRLRRSVANLRAYSSARSLVTRAEIFLDANEAPAVFSGPGIDSALNRYPEPQPARLKNLLSRLYGVLEDQLLLTRGADEAIDVVVRTFCEAREDAVIVCPPTYGVYEICADLQGAAVVRVPLVAGTFHLDVPAVLAAWQPNVKIVFVCSPNNPTGNTVPPKDIEALLRGLDGKAVVVLDEAYGEFSTAASFSSRVEEFRNLVVLRTLSKAWAMAGARCGAAIANAELTEILQKVRAPYPLSLPATNAVCEVLTKGLGREFSQRIEATALRREQFAHELGQMAMVQKIYPSEANFLLMKVANARKLVAHCRSQGIIIRDRSLEYGLRDCVRITIGSADELSRVTRCLREFSEASA